MEPSVQYATTSDSVSIAYYTIGKGNPFVILPAGPWGSIEIEWRIPQCCAWYEQLAKDRMLVRYDIRGIGLSEQVEPDFSPESHVLDLEAVIDRLGLENFALLAPQHAGPAAIMYAARHIKKVSHLLLWMSYVRGSDYYGSARSRRFTEPCTRIGSCSSKPRPTRSWTGPKVLRRIRSPSCCGANSLTT
jgi:pimeloyl-ACP methyl ester carboxylesterase